MTRHVRELLDYLRIKQLSPNTKTLHANGLTTLLWYVDHANTDRYIRLTDSFRSQTFVIYRRDNDDAVITVEHGLDPTVQWIQKQLRVLLDLPGNNQ